MSNQGVYSGQEESFVRIGNGIFNPERIKALCPYYERILQPDIGVAPLEGWKLAVQHLISKKGFTYAEIAAFEQMLLMKHPSGGIPLITVSHQLAATPTTSSSPSSLPASAMTAPPIAPQSTPSPHPPIATPAPVIPFPQPAPPTTSTESIGSIRLGDGTKQARELPFDPELLINAILSTFQRVKELRVPWESLGFEDSPRVVSLKIRQAGVQAGQPQPDLIAPAKVERAVDILKVYAGLPENANPVIRARSGHIAIEIQKPKEYWYPCLLQENDVIPKPRLSKPTDDLKILLGRGLKNQIISVNLSDRTTPHLLIGGMTGGGKSAALDTIIFGSMMRHSPRHLQMVLIDPEEINFAPYASSPWLWQNRGIVSSGEEIQDVIKTLLESEKEKRLKIFKKHRVDSIARYNALPGVEPLYRILVVFDEFFLARSLAENKEEFDLDLVRCGNEFAKYGISLCVATQHTDAQHTLHPNFRPCFKARVALMTADDAASEKILGEGCKMARHLQGNGDAYIRVCSQIDRAQIFYSDPKIIDNLMQIAKSPQHAANFPRPRPDFTVGGRVVNMGDFSWSTTPT